ncbi:MAG: hypothetical protein AAGL34_05405 [Bacteroidota bacterium]
MNKSLLYIFFGCLAIAMGFGSNSGEVLPSWSKLSIGILALGYGIYLNYSHKTQTRANASDSNLNKRIASNKVRPSYTYLIIGVLLLSFSKYLNQENDYRLDFWNIVVWTAGLSLCIYGLYFFFKERREKKESGNIE